MSGESPLDVQARDWVCLLASGRATGRAARRLQRWCARSEAHQAAFARAREQWHDAARAAALHRHLYPETDAAAAQAAPASPRRSPGGEPDGVAPGRLAPDGPAPAFARTGRPRDPARRRWLAAGGLAAAGAAAGAAAAFPPLGLWPSWQELGADYRTGVGEQRRVALSPHIELVLNTRTSLAVQSAGAQESVRLIAGEAAVRRTAGAAALELLAGGARIVPGVGSVELRRAGERYCLTCAEGEAELRHPARTLVLRAGQRVWYGQADVAEVAAADMEQALAWQRGVLAFRAMPLAEAVEEINRYRRGRVVLVDPALAQRRLSGHFRIDALDEALVQIEQVFGAAVTRLPGGVVLLG